MTHINTIVTGALAATMLGCGTLLALYDLVPTANILFGAAVGVIGKYGLDKRPGA